MTLEPDKCIRCAKPGPVNYWLPERYAADNYSPSSFSGDELIPMCEPCSVKLDMSHDPNKPRKPFAWL